MTKPAKPKAEAPTGRNISAQGNAPGIASSSGESPESANQGAWPVVPLCEVVEINPRSSDDKLADDMLASFIPMKCVEEESGRFNPLGDRRVAEVRKGYTSFRDGDVLFAKVTPCMENGKGAIMRGLTNGIGFGSTEFFALRPAGRLDACYLLHFILQSSFRQQAAQNMTGAVGLRRVPKSYLEQQTIPLPPLDDQHRIVAEIEKQFTRLEAGVAALRRVQANLKRYRAAVLKAACEGDWPQRPLGEIAEVRLGKMLDKTKHVNGRKLPYLRNVNVRWGKTDTDDLREMYFEENQLERYGLKAGDVLVCEGGEPGRAAVWSGHLPEVKYQKAIHRVRFKIPFDPRLLVWLLEQLALTGGLERRFTGSTIKHFTREAFIELPIPIPPLAEQTRIVAEVERRLSVVEELEAVVTTNLQRATRLRQSILQKAFAGEMIAADRAG